MLRSVFVASVIALLALPPSLAAAPKKKGPTKIPWPKGVPRTTASASASSGPPIEVSATSFLQELSPDDYARRVKFNQGNVVVLVMWATWCPVCRKELPVLEGLARRYVSRGVTMMSVSVDQEEEPAQRYLRDHPTFMTPIWEARGDNPQSVALQTLGAPPSTAIPRILMFHKSGVLAQDLRGGYPELTLQQDLDSLARE